MIFALRALFYLGARGGGRLYGHILAYDERLVRIKSAAPCVVERHGIGVDRVALRCDLHGVFEAALFTGGEVAADKVGGGGAGVAAPGRPESGERVGVLAELRIVLRL